MTLSQPIGIFDSGVGGLSIYQGIRDTLPNEHLLYVGDIKHSPYGNKSADFIEQRCIAICQYLIDQNVKAIVIACNTATLSVIRRLRELFDVAIIGVEPAVKPAAQASKTGQVGVLATQTTVSSERFETLMKRVANGTIFHTVACSGLVDQIEQLKLTDSSTKALLSDFLKPLLTHNIDGLVLGCTHYPFIKPLLYDLVPENITIFDTAQAVAKEVNRRLHQINGLNNDVIEGRNTFYTTACGQHASRVYSTLLNKSTMVKAIVI